MNTKATLVRRDPLLKNVMRRFTPLFIIAIALVIGLAMPAQTSYAQGKPHHTQKEKKWNQRREERLKDYTDEDGLVRPDLWEEGMTHFRQMKFAAGVNRTGTVGSDSSLMLGPEAAPLSNNPLQGVQWIQIGPQPAFPIESINFQGNGEMSGEVLDVAIDPRNLSDLVIYSVTNDGGVWRSDDGGVTFEPKTDHMPSLSMGAIVLDPVNPSIVYAGTGNLFDGNGSMTTIAVKAVGIYRSVDKGESWSIVNPNGMFNGVGIARMAMPAGDVLLVATPSGLFKSVNGGMTFGTPPTYDDGQPVLAGDVEDIDLDWDDPANTIYASVNGGGVFMSTDQGDNFPTNLFTNSNGSPEDAPFNGRYAFVRFAQARTDTNRMYTTVQEWTGNPPPPDPDGDADGFYGLWRSTDGGATWTRLAGADAPAAENNGCACGYDQTIGVDPRDEDVVFIGFQELYKSTDGGVSFGTPAISRNKTHWDHHYLGWSPSTHWGGLEDDDPTPMWTGTDGGIHSTSDGGTTFNNFHNATIASNLFHHIDIGRGSAANNEYTFGGTQDTGTLHSCEPGHCDGPVASSGDYPWEMGNNGDGSGTLVDPDNPLRVYGVRNAAYYYTDDAGKNWTNPNPNSVPVPTSVWRYAIDPNDSNRVYAVTGGIFRPNNGATSLWRSDDNSGTNWTSIANFAVGARDMGTTPADSNVLWLGMVDGTLRRSLDATVVNPNFTTVNVTGSVANQSVSEVAVNPLNPDDVVVVYRGLCGGSCPNADDRMKRVFRTLDGGTTWDDISGTDGNLVGNLPNLPTHSVVYDVGTSPVSIIVSNDAGVMRTGNGGQTWERMSLGLPTADSKMLQIDDTVSPPLLRLGTYGRSVWQLAEAQGPILAVNADLGFDTVCVGERQTRIVQLFNVGSEDLIINAIFRLEGSTQFRVLSGPSTPFTINPGEEVDFTVEFLASEPGDFTATIQINSNDQFEPEYQISASGTVNAQMISTVIADSGDFGGVCTFNDFHDLDLIISNPGCGLLEVSDITTFGGDTIDFDLAGVMSFPLQIAEGGFIEVPIRFDPSGICGDTRSTTLRISSNDPDEPTKDVPVSGDVPCPDLQVAMADDGYFGNVCATDQSDLNLTLFNAGECNLNIASITSSDPSLWELPTQPTYPLVLSHDADFNLPVRFAPDTCTLEGPETGTITIVSDAPGESPFVIDVSGDVPCPNLVIDPGSLTDLYAFPATVVDTTETLGCYSDETAVVRNTGLCPMTIDDITTDVADYNVIAPTSYPIVLPPGEETLEVTVRFTPQDGGDPLTPTEVTGILTVHTDDPDAVDEAPMCGEGAVQSGFRALVTDTTTGLPIIVDPVESITLRSKGKSTPSPVNMMFTDKPAEGPLSVCGNDINWHLQLETLAATQTTGQGGGKSQYELLVKDGNLQDARSFSLGQCDFLDFQMQLKSSDGGGGGICLLKPKGESCDFADECCSGKCTGKPGAKTCN